MSNIIKIKRGDNPPPDGALQSNELGYANRTNSLYIGIEEEVEQTKQLKTRPVLSNFVDQVFFTYDDLQSYNDAIELSEKFGGTWEYLGSITTSTNRTLHAWYRD